MRRERVSVNQECVGFSTPFVEEVAFWTELDSG
jgi:hypothetical protein